MTGSWSAFNLPPGVRGSVLVYMTSTGRLLGWARTRSGLIWEALVVPAKVPGGVLNVVWGGDLLGVYSRGAEAQKAVEDQFTNVQTTRVL